MKMKDPKEELKDGEEEEDQFINVLPDPGLISPTSAPSNPLNTPTPDDLMAITPRSLNTLCLKTPTSSAYNGMTVGIFFRHLDFKTDPVQTPNFFSYSPNSVKAFSTFDNDERLATPNSAKSTSSVTETTEGAGTIPPFFPDASPVASPDPKGKRPGDPAINTRNSKKSKRPNLTVNIPKDEESVSFPWNVTLYNP